MSQIQKLVVKTEGKGISAGANTKVYVDGIPLEGVTYLKLEFKANKVTKILMEMVAPVEVEINGEINQKISNQKSPELGKVLRTLTKRSK